MKNGTTASAAPGGCASRPWAAGVVDRAAATVQRRSQRPGARHHHRLGADRTWVAGPPPRGPGGRAEPWPASLVNRPDHSAAWLNRPDQCARCPCGRSRGNSAAFRPPNPPPLCFELVGRGGAFRGCPCPGRSAWPPKGWLHRGHSGVECDSVGGYGWLRASGCPSYVGRVRRQRSCAERWLASSAPVRPPQAVANPLNAGAARRRRARWRPPTRRRACRSHLLCRRRAARRGRRSGFGQPRSGW
jgi:hypothetical protein